MHRERPNQKTKQQEQGVRPEREIISYLSNTEDRKTGDRLDERRRHQRNGKRKKGDDQCKINDSQRHLKEKINKCQPDMLVTKIHFEAVKPGYTLLKK